MKRFNAFKFNFSSEKNIALKQGFDKGLNISEMGTLQMVDESNSIRQSILMILSTIPGERIMRPDYGCELYKLTFSPNDETTAGIAIHYIKKAITKWEQRIQIIDIDAVPNAVYGEILDITMSYTIKKNLNKDFLTYSFNLEGSEAHD
ncbi:GPW/gp25 family protein [Desulfobacter curvatus]|uniref:GPW/gp25 family protein n=1 Tax=Desulfobacter curvatus TaxID=2290 RepID=UPI0003653D1A|nr:GPW/gp25 family protein [Desulfobacter curvatus]